ncbi:terminase gpA endonuclease subunit [Sulfitobacter guttiformis]|nr:terminase gpA endonuclease subunit [Sulfitobacter guttiformis]
MIELLATQDELREAIAHRRNRAMDPPPDVTGSEWADMFRKVPSETSAVTGQWETSTYEVARGPMDAITELGVRVISGVASAQIFKTSTGETAIGYFMHLNPRPILVYEPTETTVDAFVDSKLDPMIKETPELAALWGGRAAIERKNDKFVHSKKTFPGGYVEILTANSPANTASRSAGVVFMDEVDKFEMTRDGDAVALIDERLKGFTGEDLSIRMSTPTDADSPIMAEYMKSDRRKPYVKCPHCKDWDYYRWENVEKDGDPEDAAYNCGICGVAWTEAQRVKVLTTKGKIKWRQTRPFSCCDEAQDPEVEKRWDKIGRAVCKTCGERRVSNRHAGFWAWELYHPRRSVADLIRSFQDSKNNPGKMQNFTNSKLARIWDPEDDGDQIEVDPEQFRLRVEQPWTMIPAQVLAVFVGVDVQPQGKKGLGRLEVSTLAFGAGDEIWSLSHEMIFGDITEGDVWAKLDEILMADYLTEDGRTLRIMATCIDTGGDTEQGGAVIDAVTSYASRRKRLNVFAIKGASDQGTLSPIWPSSGNMRTAAKRNGAWVYMVGVQAARDWLASCQSKTKPGPGFIHVPADRGEEWFDQMTNYEKKRIRSGGKNVMRWLVRAKHVRKDAADAFIYAKAALEAARRISPEKMNRLIMTAPAAAIATAETDVYATQAAQPQAAPPKRKRMNVVGRPSGGQRGRPYGRR